VSLSGFPWFISSFVSGHGFSRAVKAANDEGFSPCGSSVLVRKVNYHVGQTVREVEKPVEGMRKGKAEADDLPKPKTPWPPP
jgi:hypothetical protein